MTILVKLKAGCNGFFFLSIKAGCMCCRGCFAHLPFPAEELYMVIFLSKNLKKSKIVSRSSNTGCIIFNNVSCFSLEPHYLANLEIIIMILKKKKKKKIVNLSSWPQAACHQPGGIISKPMLSYD